MSKAKKSNKSKKEIKSQNNSAEKTYKFPLPLCISEVVFMAVALIYSIIEKNIIKVGSGVFYTCGIIYLALTALGVILAILCIVGLIKNKKMSTFLSVTAALVLALSVWTGYSSVDYVKDFIGGSEIVTTNQFALMGRNPQIRFEDNYGELTAYYITEEQKAYIEDNASIDEGNYFNEKYLNNYDKSFVIEYYKNAQILKSIEIE